MHRKDWRLQRGRKGERMQYCGREVNLNIRRGRQVTGRQVGMEVRMLTNQGQEEKNGVGRAENIRRTCSKSVKIVAHD